MRPIMIIKRPIMIINNHLNIARDCKGLRVSLSQSCHKYHNFSSTICEDRNALKTVLDRSKESSTSTASVTCESKILGWNETLQVLCHNDTFPLPVLIDGSDLLAMDEGGTSDPYCKFKWVPTELKGINCLMVMMWFPNSDAFWTKLSYKWTLLPKGGR